MSGLNAPEPVQEKGGSMGTFRHCLRSLCLVLGLLFVTNVMAEAGDWLVRLRGIVVAPNDESDEVFVAGAPVDGSGVGVDKSLVPELDFTYMLTHKWGVELILGTSFHDVEPQGSVLIDALGGDDSNIIDTNVLPPTLTLQYHFMPDEQFRPYLGIGINYTIFYDEKVTGALDAPDAKVDLDDSVGLALQAGIDFAIKDEWFVNLDIKYIDIDTDAEFSNTVLGPGVPVSVDLSVDPMVFGFGIGRRF